MSLAIDTRPAPDADLPPWRRWSRTGTAIRILIAVVVAGLCMMGAARQFGALDWREVASSLQRMGPGVIGLSALAAAISFAMIAAYDRLSLGYVGKELSWRRSAQSSTIAYAIGNVAGFAAVTGLAVKYLYFRRWGLGVGDVAAAGVIGSLAYNSVQAVLSGTIILVWPHAAAELTGAPDWAVRAGGLIALIAGAGILLWAAFARREWRIGTVRVRSPGWRHVGLHAGVCAIDYVMTSAVFYIPVTGGVDWGLLPFAMLFGAAHLLAVASNVPAGVGVLEFTALAILPGAAKPGLAAALIVYRIVYYLAPFCLALAALAASGLIRRRRRQGDAG